MYRVKVGEALAGKVPLSIKAAMRLAGQLLVESLGFTPDPHENEPPPSLRLRQLVTMPGKMRRVEPGELDSEGGWETAIFKVLSWPMKCEDGWRVWIGRSPNYLKDPINALCRELRPLERVS